MDNSDEAITLSDSKGEEIDKTPLVSDNENDNRYWMRNDSEWIFDVKELEKGKIWNGVVKHVEDFDLLLVTLSSLYTFVVFPLVFWGFSKSS